MIVANRVRGDDDLEMIRAAVGYQHEYVVVPDEPAIAQADRDGVAAIDVDAGSPGVRAIVELADRITGVAVPA